MPKRHYQSTETAARRCWCWGGTATSIAYHADNTRRYDAISEFGSPESRLVMGKYRIQYVDERDWICTP